mgnify:CR=1 FL=1
MPGNGHPPQWEVLVARLVGLGTNIMAFTGIFPAMDISPSALGLFAVANPSANADEKNEDKGTRGFSQEYNSRPSYVRLWDDTSAVSYVVADNNAAPLFIEITPIFIEVEDLDHMIEYYENLEEYEKCQKILDIKNNTVSETILT